MTKKKKYSSVQYPTRNYWGNLYDEDTYDEERHHFNDNGSALYDAEDDHDSYYENFGYD